jgi:hypothetical protein
MNTTKSARRLRYQARMAPIIAGRKAAQAEQERIAEAARIEAERAAIWAEMVAKAKGKKKSSRVVGLVPVLLVLMAFAFPGEEPSGPINAYCDTTYASPYDGTPQPPAGCVFP